MAKPARKPLVKCIWIRKRQSWPQNSSLPKLLAAADHARRVGNRCGTAKPTTLRPKRKQNRRSALQNLTASQRSKPSGPMMNIWVAASSEVGICVPVPYGADIASAFMQGMKPRSLLETLLFSQMIGVHIAAMRELQRLSETSDLERATLYVSRANRLLRMFGLQIEALESLRGKGRQKIRSSTGTSA